MPLWSMRCCLQQVTESRAPNRCSRDDPSSSYKTTQLGSEPISTSLEFKFFRCANRQLEWWAVMTMESIQRLTSTGQQRTIRSLNSPSFCPSAFSFLNRQRTSSFLHSPQRADVRVRLENARGNILNLSHVFKLLLAPTLSAHSNGDAGLVWGEWLLTAP